VTYSPPYRSERLPADYPRFLAEIKARIAAERTRAVLAVLQQHHLPDQVNRHATAAIPACSDMTKQNPGDMH
jgi:hypothetical protein